MSIKKKLLEFGIEPKKSLGQNFLINDHVIDKIIMVAKNSKLDHMVEIGPGVGALTDSLALMKKDFLLLELDSRLAEIWRNKGLKVKEGDALKFDWESLIEPTLLVSNLPYQISSSLVIERSVKEDPVQEMVLMFQKEVAQRIMSEHSASNYGLLSVVAQSFWKIKKLVDAGPGSFFPPPKIDSRVLTFIKKETPIKDKERFLKFCKACFKFRRKKLINNIKKEMNIESEILLSYYKQQGYSEGLRAQELSVEDMQSLYFHIGGE